MGAERDDALASAMALQERCDEIFADARTRGEVADLSYANPYDPPPDEVLRAIADGVFSERALALQYTPFGGRTSVRRAVAAHLTRVHGVPYDWNRIVLTPGAMGALSIAFRSLGTRPGDRVGVLVPCWQDYPLYLRNLDLVPVFIPLARPSFEIDCEAVAASLREAPLRALVLSQPANPTGVSYSKANLAALARTLSAYSPTPLLISDEAHGAVLFGDAALASPASLYANTCTVRSFGKAYQIQGQRIGAIAISREVPEGDRLRDEMIRACRYTGISTPTALMQDALPRLLKLTPDLSKFALRRRRIVDALRGAGVEVAPGEHTFFVYARCERDDLDVVRGLASSQVLALPGSMFHDPGHVRFSVTASDPMIDRAVDVLREGARALFS